MTPQEQQMIDGLFNRIRTTQVQNKDAEAEQHIQQGLGSYPDALYVLTQTVLVQGYGLEQAQSQLNELKQANQLLQEQLQQTSEQGKSSSGSFLSHIFGGGSNNPSPAPPPSQQPQYQPVNTGYGTQGYPAPPPPPPVAYPPQGYPAQGHPTQGYPPGGGGMFGGGGGGGFLQGALQTAAGVAAGEMVFQGMEDLFHGFGGHHGGYGFGGGAGGGTVIENNYYDEDRDQSDRGRDFGDRSRDDSGFYNASNDASRENFGDTTQGSSGLDGFGGDSAGLTDAGRGNDDLSFDNTGSDSSLFDDNGSSDDFSSSDDNS